MSNIIKEFLIRNRIVVIIVLVVVFVFTGVFSYYYFRKPINKVSENLAEKFGISKLNIMLQSKESDELIRSRIIKAMTATSTTSNYSNKELENLAKQMTAKPSSKFNLSQEDKQKLIDSMTTK